MKTKLILASVLFFIGITGAHASENIKQDTRDAIVELGFEPTSDINIDVKTKTKVLQGLLHLERKVTFGLHDVNTQKFYSTVSFKQNNLNISCNVYYELDRDQLIQLVIKSDACRVTTKSSINKRF